MDLISGSVHGRLEVVIDLDAAAAQRPRTGMSVRRSRAWVLDADPLVVNEYPDELRCLSCGQTQMD